MSEIDQQFIEFVVKSLVGKPDVVQVQRSVDEKGVLLELTVDPEDLGRVIGKRGATAQSLRTLLRALGTKNDARYNLKIVDNGEPGMGSAPARGSNSSNVDDAGDSSVASNSTRQSDDDDEDEFPSRASAPASSVVDKTRKELEELDDLDV